MKELERFVSDTGRLLEKLPGMRVHLQKRLNDLGTMQDTARAEVLAIGHAEDYANKVGDMLEGNV